MITKVLVKGQMVIPEALREQAHIHAGDELDVCSFYGLIVLRKRRALTPWRIRSLLLAPRDLPEQSPSDEITVVRAIGRVRKGRKF